MAQGLGLNGDMMGIPSLMLKAISAGAVFMGANSYIGNGPNFMVKAIAEEYKLKMPSFFGYMAYSVGRSHPALSSSSRSSSSGKTSPGPPP